MTEIDSPSNYMNLMSSFDYNHNWSIHGQFELIMYENYL